MKRRINNLEDIRREKKLLAAKRKIAREEFSNQLDVVHDTASSYLLKKVVLPIGVGVISSFLLKTFLSSWRSGPASGQEGEEIKRVYTRGSGTSWIKYFSILLSLYKIYQSATHSHGAGSNRDSRKEVSPPLNPKDFVRDFKSKTPQQTTTDPATTT